MLPESSLYIIGEYFQRIELCLMGVKGTVIQDIRQAYSHEQALSQSRHTLEKLGITMVKHADTAGACAYLAQTKDMHTGAIGSSLAAEIYGLTILKHNIEDKPNNTTRFIILSRTPVVPVEGKQCITSCIFYTRNITACLYKALGGFATNGVNMVKLESYLPLLDGGGEAHFYMEFVGTPEDRNVSLALEELQFYSSFIRIIGSYEGKRG